MSTYKDCQKHINSFYNFKMDTKDDTTDDACLSPYNASPPDFDFNLPCRFFKSSFARSLSLNNSSNSNSSSSQCKSLDYDMYSNNSNNNKLSCLNRDTTAVSTVPPLPQRRLSQAGSFYQQNEANTCEQKHVFTTEVVADDQEKPPALPARCPVSLHNSTLARNLNVNECQKNEEQQMQQSMLTQLRQQAYKQAANNSNNNPVKLVSGNSNNNNNNNNSCSSKNYTDHHSMGLQSSAQQPTLNQKPQPHHFAASINSNVTGSNNNNHNNNSSVKSKNNFRSKNIVWPNQKKNVEQDCNICNFVQVAEDTNDDELNSKLSGINNYNNRFHNSHQMLHMTPSINIHNNQQQQQQNEKQHHQQQQHQHHMPSYEILNDNSTNVEAVILQNQVDTLQWQLKQVETSCDMYRAVMEEVARFLERYQSQKQLQQQQQQQQLQQQMATYKHYNNNNSNSNKVEQIPRSKSLFQVYVAGGHEKSTNGRNVLDETTSATELSSASASTSASASATSTSTSYLRARSSTNLIDLKHQPSNSSGNDKKNKDDHHIFETNLKPSQSYTAFKDFTWRRSPKKTDSRLNIAKDDVEEKLNLEAFRLLRTIQNLLNTSQHQPDLANPRQSLAPTPAAQIGRLSKAMSTTSVMTLPGPPMLNSTSLITNTNGAGSTTTDPSTASASPTITTANNAASNNLAPEMLFLRSANMRDSRLSLRSSTDSSVHSTSSVTSSASSKVETDEEPSTKFPSPPNILGAHKQHLHITGSSTEDESGFSSISSFPDIGVPLNSTTLSSSTSSAGKSRLIGKELKSLKANERVLQTTDSRNSTLKANVVGLPLNSPQDMSHRWDSPSKTYHNASNKLQRFSALTNEDSNAVLWV